MAKDYASVNVDVWADPDFRKLPAPAQHLYLMLWTSPGLSYCGVHDWRPGRIAALADGLNVDVVRTIADCLEARHFIVTDDETEEVLIRSWVRFDGLMKKPRMAISCITAYGEVASNDLRGVIVHELLKVQRLEPGLAAWSDSRVKKVLENPSVDPKACPSVTDPFADGFTYAFAVDLPQTRLGVCTPPTPAPAPAPYSSAPSASRSKGARKKPEHPIPEDWKPTDKHVKQAAEKGADLSTEAFRFRNHALTHDRRCVNWNAAFTNWLSKAKAETSVANRGQQPEGW